MDFREGSCRVDIKRETRMLFARIKDGKILRPFVWVFVSGCVGSLEALCLQVKNIEPSLHVDFNYFINKI